MKLFIAADSEGEILFTASYAVDTDAPPSMIEVPVDFVMSTDKYYDHDEKKVTNRTQKPDNHVWKNKTWVPDTPVILQSASNKRTAILMSTDYIMLSDSPVANKDEWAAYRQALRDLDVTDPLVVWPVPPEYIKK